MLDFHVTPGKPPPTGKRAAKDDAVCEWNGQRFQVRAFSATTALARKLVAAGCPDQPWQSFSPNGKRSLYGPSVHRWAEWTAVETDTVGPRFHPYREYPNAGTRDDSQTAPG